MSEHRSGENGLESIIRILEMRYEMDDDGRMASVLGDGALPRFVLGRAREGCVWRFGCQLETESVIEVARLAGREPGFPIAGETPTPPPERLVMIERLLAVDPAERVTRHEALRIEGDIVAELWTIE